MGKREVGQLGIIDLIVSILIAELAVLSIEELDKSIFISIVPILTLTLLQTMLAYFSLKKPKFRILLDGNPSLIIKNGKVNFKEMTKQKYNLDDLLVQLREKGFKSIEEIEYAILENNGTLSVFAYEEEKDNYLPLPLILDNKIQEDAQNRDKIQHQQPGPHGLRISALEKYNDNRQYNINKNQMLHPEICHPDEKMSQPNQNFHTLISCYDFPVFRLY